MADATQSTDTLTGTELKPLATLAGVCIRPLDTFRRMREANRSHWWLLFVLAVLALLILTAVTLPLTTQVAQAEYESQMEGYDSSQFSAEQQAALEQQQRIFTSQAYLGIISVVGGIVALLIGYLVRGFLLFLLGLALGGRASFRQVWRMAVWTTLPNVARTLAQAIASLITRGQPELGLRYILTDAELANASPYLLTFLSKIDLYVIWGLVLIGFGMAATSKLSRGKAALVALIYWLISLGFALGMTGLGQALSNALGVG